MADEIELKFIEIDKDQIINQLQSISAIKEYETQLESRHFESEELGFSGSNSTKKFLRVRKVNGKTLITFKGPTKNKDVHVREEIELETNDFDAAILLFSKMGLDPAPLFSKKRTHFSLGEEIHFEIDELPNVPAYLEIETKTIEQLNEVCGKLDLDPKDGHAKTIVEIYPDKFEKR